MGIHINNIDEEEIEIIGRVENISSVYHEIRKSFIEKEK